MVGLSRVGERGRRHRHLQPGEHVVKLLYPEQLVLFLHGEVHRDAQKHLLRRLEQSAVVIVYDVALEHQLEGGVGEQLVPFAVDERRAGGAFLPGIVFGDISAVQPARGQIVDFLRKAGNLPLCLFLREPGVHVVHHEARGEKFPLRGFLRGQFDGSAHERPVACGVVHCLAEKGAVFVEQLSQIVFLLRKVRLHALEELAELPIGKERREFVADRALFRARVAVEDKALGLLEIPRLHHGLFREILHGLDRGHRAGQFGDHAVRKRVQYGFARRGIAFGKGFGDGVSDFLGSKLLFFSVPLDDFHPVPH